MTNIIFNTTSKNKKYYRISSDQTYENDHNISTHTCPLNVLPFWSEKGVALAKPIINKLFAPNPFSKFF